MAIFRVHPVHIAFAIADHQIAIIQHRRGQQTVQQIALCPQGHAAIGSQRQQAVILVNQIDTVAIDDEIIHRTQLAFPHNLATTQIQRGQVTVISQRIDNAVDDNRRGVDVAQTVDFRRPGGRGNTLLPNHLPLLHQYRADAAIVAAHDRRAVGGGRSGFAAQGERRHIQVHRPFHGAIGLIQRLQLAVTGVDQYHAIAHHRARQRFAGDAGLPGHGTIAGIQRIQLRFFTADINMAARDGHTAGKQRRGTREPAIFLRQIHRPYLFTIVGVQRFDGAFTVSGINHAVGEGRMKVRVKFADTIANRGAPGRGRRKLVFYRRQR
ncbi:hypothetical protein SB00610_02172 [Klebsiella quasipneumoniae subsp. similipneumoniae]|nr:hypothetical protein SB00610_02172 [Klebsiella quasipneumoniae subsp. similipneumoniae]